MDGPKKKLVTNFELVVIMRMTPYRIINNNCSGANTISHSRQGHGFLGVEVKRGWRKKKGKGKSSSFGKSRAKEEE